MHILHDLVHFGRILVANPDGFVDSPVRHPRRVLQCQFGKDGIRDVERSLVKGSHYRQSPANTLNRSFDFPVRRSYPVSYRERPVKINHETTKKIRQQILRSKTHRDPANATEGQQRRDFNSEGWQGNQYRRDDNRKPGQFRQRMQGCRIQTALSVLCWRLQIVKYPRFSQGDEAHQKNHGQNNKSQLTDNIQIGGAEQDHIQIPITDLDGPDQPEDQNEPAERALRRFKKRVIPDVCGFFKLLTQNFQRAHCQIPSDESEHHHGKQLYSPPQLGNTLYR